MRPDRVLSTDWGLYELGCWPTTAQLKAQHLQQLHDDIERLKQERTDDPDRK